MILLGFAPLYPTYLTVILRMQLSTQQLILRFHKDREAPNDPFFEGSYIRIEC